jgi:hypothetical protein
MLPSFKILGMKNIKKPRKAGPTEPLHSLYKEIYVHFSTEAAFTPSKDISSRATHWLNA